jgi:lipoprotein-releasing system ATP-binding protein
MNNLITARGLTKSYPMGTSRLEVLRGIDVDIKAGEAVSIVGSSGAGKSTLLHILGTLDRPTLGKVTFKGVDLSRETDEKLAEFRNRSMGFVFQFHHLMAEFTALENVIMPCRIAGMTPAQGKEKALKLLEFLGLKDRLSHYPSELSGGEQQRIAIARALVRDPEVLFADEPTGNLDTTNAARIQELFFELKNRMNLTLIVVTHDSAFAARFPRTLRMRDGLWDGASQEAFR